CRVTTAWQLRHPLRPFTGPFTWASYWSRVGMPGTINWVSSPRGVPMFAFIARVLPGSLLAFITAFTLLAAAPQARADDKVIRVGTLKLIHGITPYFYEKFAPAGYTVEVIPFESPTDGKNAVVTGTVD